MKILMVVNWYTSITEDVYTAGVFHYEQSMAIKQYEDVRLYWPFDENVIGLQSGEEKGLYTYRSQYNMHENKISLFIRIRKHLNSIIEEYRPDIIHAHVAYPTGLISLICAHKYNIPVVLTEHSPIEQMNLDKIHKRLMRKWVYEHCKRNVCVSIDSMNRLSKVFKKVNFEVIYNAVIDPETIEKDEVIYKKDGCTNFAIVAAFYDKEIKGYQLLIPAMKDLVTNNKNIVLHICGGGIYEEYYKNLVKELGIEENCIFYGQCERRKVYSIVSQMDFCVSTSLFECSGVSVQEEMLLGKPILVTKSGGANSLCTEDTSIVIDRGSKKAIVDGVNKMINELSEFNTDKIREYAYKNFEISNITQKYMELYNEILMNK